MHPILRNILALVAGLLIGMSVNMLLIMVSGFIIPPPEGTDLSTPEGLKAAMPLFETKHFIMPFLAHALGTLVGAIVVVKLAVSQHFIFALIIGCFFLYGGIMMITMVPSPVWFNVVDLGLAYIPMAIIGWKIGEKQSQS